MELIDGGRHGWRLGDFFASRTCQHMGVVLRVHDWGLEVLWDDKQVGHLVFDKDAPNSVDTVQQLALVGDFSLKDFLNVPIDDLWRAASQRCYPESFPRLRQPPVSTGDYLHAL